MQKHQLKQVIEALLFVAEQPLTESQLAEQVESQQITKKQIRDVLDELQRLSRAWRAVAKSRFGL